MQGFVNAISDSAYAHPVDTAAKLHAMKSMSDVFVYHFGYRGKNTHTTLDINNYPPKVKCIFLKICLATSFFLKDLSGINSILMIYFQILCTCVVCTCVYIKKYFHEF